MTLVVANGTNGARRPPGDEQVERSLLGAALADPTVLGNLQPNQFVRPAHQHIAAAILQARTEGWTPTPETVADLLQRNGVLDQCGGLGELLSMRIDAPAASSTGRHRTLVDQHARSRKIITLAAELGEAGYTGTDPTPILERMRALDGADADGRPGDSWRPLNLAAVVEGLIAGTIDRPEPSVGQLSDGRHLFYQPGVNGIAGGPGAGKSLAVQAVTVQHLRDGGHVLWVDHEDHEISTVARLLDLGGDGGHIVERFHYLHPDTGYSVAAEAALADALAGYDNLERFLAVVDSVGESLALDGYNGNDDPDVTAWFARLPKQLANRGACVVVIDHIVKAVDTDGLWPIGSQRKLASITGAQYMLQPAKPFTKDMAGSARLVCAKDRHGHHARGARVADFNVEPDAGRINATFVASAPGSEFRPTFLMERISRYLEINPGATTRRIRDDVAGNHAAKAAALQLLVAEGHVEVVKVGQSHQHKISTPYRETDETAPVYDEPPGDEDDDAGPEF